MFSIFRRIFKKEPLYFHRSFLKQEFSGETPEEVVQALYEDSKPGMDNITFADWWEYQRKVHAIKYDTPFPDIDEPEACQKLLVCCLKAGGLEYGRLSQNKTTKAK